MRKKLMNALIPMSLTLASLPAAAQTTGDRPDYWHYGWDWGWGHMIFGSLMMILFWGGIILAIVTRKNARCGLNLAMPMPVTPRACAHSFHGSDKLPKA